MLDGFWRLSFENVIIHIKLISIKILFTLFMLVYIRYITLINKIFKSFVYFYL